MSLPSDAAGQQLGKTTAHFEVLDQDVEFANPAADPDQMAHLANLTRDSGGRAVASEQLAALLEEIKKHPPELVEEVLTKWQLADTWWDAWLVLGIFVGLLAIEWFLRSAGAWCEARRSQAEVPARQPIAIRDELRHFVFRPRLQQFVGAPGLADALAQAFPA